MPLIKRVYRTVKYYQNLTSNQSYPACSKDQQHVIQQQIIFILCKKASGETILGITYTLLKGHVSSIENSEGIETDDTSREYQCLTLETLVSDDIEFWYRGDQDCSLRMVSRIQTYLNSLGQEHSPTAVSRPFGQRSGRVSKQTVVVLR